MLTKKVSAATDGYLSQLQLREKLIVFLEYWELGGWRRIKWIQQCKSHEVSQCDCDPLWIWFYILLTISKYESNFKANIRTSIFHSYEWMSFTNIVTACSPFTLNTTCCRKNIRYDMRNCWTWQVTTWACERWHRWLWEKHMRNSWMSQAAEGEHWESFKASSALVAPPVTSWEAEMIQVTVSELPTPGTDKAKLR